MNSAPPRQDDPHKVDIAHLNLLSVFHFVGAGFSFLGLGFLFLHYLFFRLVFVVPFKAAMSDPKMFQGTNAVPAPRPPSWILDLFHWFYVLGALVLIGFAVVNVISALNLRARRNRNFSMVVAGLNCIHIPIGTVLGVFTLVVLSRPSVEELYRNPKT